MTVREKILSKIQAAKISNVVHPGLPIGIKYEDLLGRFRESVKMAGGTSELVEGSLQESIEKIPVYASAKNRVSVVENAGNPNVLLDNIRDPHELENIDLAIMKGEFGVAENGAIWVDHGTKKNRVVYFITQHLALLLDRTRIYSNLHEAYEHIHFPGPGFGVFISGPSKTADIEQTLVIGAHGARSLTVLLT